MRAAFSLGRLYNMRDKPLPCDYYLTIQRFLYVRSTYRNFSDINTYVLISENYNKHFATQIHRLVSTGILKARHSAANMQSLALSQTVEVTIVTFSYFFTIHRHDVNECWKLIQHDRHRKSHIIFYPRIEVVRVLDCVLF